MTDIKSIKNTEATFFPKPQPMWKKLPAIMPKLEDYMACYIFNGLQVIVTAEIRDDREWLHVSFSRANKLPDYKDIQMVKRDFIGEDKKAIMVFPEKEFYVNTHPYCLHLWYSAENPLPEFSVNVFGTRQI